MSTIMIVEDAPIIRQPIEATLNRAGYETITAENGAEAIKLLAETSPDLVLLDLAMPVMDGIAFLHTIRSEPKTKHLPVIVLTAIAEKPRVVQAVKLGISAYLLKSRFSLEEMLNLIEQHLNGPMRTMGSSNSGPSAADEQSAPPATQSPTASGTSAENRSVVSNAPSTEDDDDASSPGTNESASTIAADAPRHMELPPLTPETDPLEVLKSLKPLMTRSEITDRIEQAEGLKGMSPAVTQVLKLTGNTRCSIEQVAKAISQDHAMALKILKLANSAVYTRGEPVDSVQLAVSRIGLGQIRQTVLNLSVIDQFSDGQLAGGIEFGQFWEHAIAVGLIAAELTRPRDESDLDTAFTMGLLHDVGRLFFVDNLGALYAEVVRVADALKLPLETVESRLLIYNHADVMDRVLHQWKFPKQLINPIVFHHLSAGNMRRNAPRQIEEAATLGLANRLAHAMMLGTSGNQAIYPTEEFCNVLNLDPDVIRLIHNSTREETDKIKFSLLATSSSDNWEPLRNILQSSLAKPIRPIVTSSAPQYDAYRIFCEELASTYDDEQDSMPNVGVIHLTNARDRVALTSSYRQAESAAGVSNLPLIILSPAGKILPETSLLNDRAYETLSTPFVAMRFIEACNRLLQPAQARAA